MDNQMLRKLAEFSAYKENIKKIQKHVEQMLRELKTESFDRGGFSIRLSKEVEKILKVKKNLEEKIKIDLSVLSDKNSKKQFPNLIEKLYNSIEKLNVFDFDKIEDKLRIQITICLENMKSCCKDISFIIDKYCPQEVRDSRYMEIKVKVPKKNEGFIKKLLFGR